MKIEAPDAKTIVKILIIRVGRAGDLMMITPALRALLDSYPDAEFHVLTSPDGARVLKHYSPRLTRAIVHRRSAWLAWFERRRIRREIAAAGYDKVFCFELKPTFIALFTGLATEEHAIDMSRADAHYARRCLDVVSRAVGRPLDNYWLNLPVTDAGRVSARDLLALHGITPDTIVVGFHPTYSGIKKAPWRRGLAGAKLWPPQHFARLAQLLTDDAAARGIALRIIMDLMPDERAVGEEIVQHAAGRVTLLLPPPDFSRYVATLARLNLLVTPDTGPMHIAAAVGTPVVALFGGTRPEDCGPFVPPAQYRVVQPAQPAQGIAGITPGQVFDACRALLAQH